jgi:hypothetical protein
VFHTWTNLIFRPCVSGPHNKGAAPDFGENITKTNNRQNRIENRDFVSLDPEQNRIKTELPIDKIDYQLIRSEIVTAKNESSFDLVDSTTALDCASGQVHLIVQLKREIGKLWEDIEKAPYKELFNASVSGVFVWRCVQMQRQIDQVLGQVSKSLRKDSRSRPSDNSDRRVHFVSAGRQLTKK